jgi:Zn-dependent protease
MRISWKLCRIAGIDVYVHPTFLLVLLIPGVLSGGMLSVLLIAAVFGCVLLHELGHALMAREFGISTADITLYPIGGVARLARMPRAAGAELLIALAGPAVNLGIAAVLGALGAFGVADLAGRELAEVFIDELMLVNLGLALFNLVPAFPMDGGRVLRALLSGWIGRVKATMAAAKLGRILAIGFGIVAPILTHNLLYLALAAFIYFASRAEEASVVAEEARRSYDLDDRGVWVAPPGYHWVDSGNGTWQLAPIRLRTGNPTQASSPWR